MYSTTSGKSPVVVTVNLWWCSIAQVLKNHGTTWELPKGEKLSPVLAVGSNAAPAQLARKFPPHLFPDGVVIPVLRCVLPDFDVVYAPLISSYGSCTGEANIFAEHCQLPFLMERHISKCSMSTDTGNTHTTNAFQNAQ